MPLHPKRVAMRGIDVPLLLAKVVAKSLECPLGRWRMTRTRDTPPQRGLNAQERRANVRGAFTARWVEGQDVLLVDDVLTTGASAHAASLALTRAGCSRVRVLAATYVSSNTLL